MLLVVGVLLLRRLPAVLLLGSWVPDLHGWRERALAGWFGPIGVSALFYATLALRESGVADAWVVASLIVGASLVAFAISAPGLARHHGRVSGMRPDDGSR